MFEQIVPNNDVEEDIDNFDDKENQQVLRLKLKSSKVFGCEQALNKLYVHLNKALKEKHPIQTLNDLGCKQHLRLAMESLL